MTEQGDWLPDEPWRGWAMYGGGLLAVTSCGWAAVAGWLATVVVIAGLVLACVSVAAPRRYR